MRKVALTFGVLVLTCSVLGCNLKKKKVDTLDDEVGDAATVTVSGTGAKNEKDILRYQKEDKVADEPGTIAKDGVKPRTYPGGGHEVTTLAKGTAVVKIAKYFSTAVLVSFDDPAGDGKLLGWVLPEQLATGPTAAPTVTTVRPQVVLHADAGGAKDAGVAAVDAGGSSPADAGAPAISKATLFVPAGVDGKCPAGFAAAPAGCRRPCNADADCPRTTFCAAIGAKKFCSTSK